MSNSGRRKRTLRTAGVVLAASLVLLLILNQGLSNSDPRPPATAPPNNVEPSPPTKEVPLGVELTTDGQIRLHVPRCPSTQVTEVAWLYFPRLNTVWAIERENDSIAQYDFTVGVEPSGFATTATLKQPVNKAPVDVTFSFAALRSTDSGEDLPPASASVRLNELSPGSIHYWRKGKPLGVVSSIEEFQEAVGCGSP